MPPWEISTSSFPELIKRLIIGNVDDEKEVPTCPQLSQVIRDPDTWTARAAYLEWRDEEPHRHPPVK